MYPMKYIKHIRNLNSVVDEDVDIEKIIETKMRIKDLYQALRKLNSTLKKNAEYVLECLGVPMSTAVDMFPNQIVLTGGIPFAVTFPGAPQSIDTTAMSSEEIHDKIQK